MTEIQENLLAAYFTGQITDQERAQILSLLETDKDFASCFHEMQEIYVAACIPAFEKTKEEDFGRIRERIQPRRRNRVSFWRPLAVAAALVSLVSLGIAFYTGMKFRDADHFLRTAELTTITSSRGTGTQTVLPDGTRACLNAGSSLRFGRDFGRKDREVTLEGEGYFEVAKDAEKPFRVHAGNTCTTVKGTIFNIRSYADEAEISVSLLEGSVLLSAPTGEVVLHPGNCAVVSRKNGRIRMDQANLSVADWTTGKLVFSDKTLPEILADIQRTYGVRFVYEQGIFGKERYTGSISANLTIAEILDYLDVDHKFTWIRNEDTIIIRKQ